MHRFECRVGQIISSKIYRANDNNYRNTANTGKDYQVICVNFFWILTLLPVTKYLKSSNVLSQLFPHDICEINKKNFTE